MHKIKQGFLNKIDKISIRQTETENWIEAFSKEEGSISLYTEPWLGLRFRRKDHFLIGFDESGIFLLEDSSWAKWLNMQSSWGNKKLWHYAIVSENDVVEILVENKNIRLKNENIYS
ncbi:MAG: hypothetical protein H6620_10445 [Halobacteriovoraceae bacterium]|nr:hypothetical protein [Halobacteriovoraceae bacterium]